MAYENLRVMPELDPNKEYTIEELVDYIRNAMTGKNVREALARSVEATNEIATWARDVAQGLIDGAFDAGELATMIESKLNQLEQDYAPKLTSLETEIEDARGSESSLGDRLNDFSSQLAQTEKEVFKTSLVNHKGAKKPMFLWFDDDGQRGVYTKLAPLVRDLGVKLHVAVITDRPHGFPIEGLPAYNPSSGFISYQEMKELESEGIVKYVPHTHTHDTNNRLTDMSESEMRNELETNQRIMKQLGWNYRDLVYPFGAENPFVHNIVRQYFRSAFDVGGGALTTPFNQFKMPRIRCDAPATFEEIKAQIDDVFEYGTLGALTTHVDQYGGLDLEKMEQVINYILVNGGEFVWIEEAINEFGNLLQVGSNSISYDGKVVGKEIGVYRDGGLDYIPNAPITEFEKGTVTRLKIRLSDFSDYNIPNDTRLTSGYGFIEVYRDSAEDGFSFQTLLDRRNSKLLIRNWNASENDWDKWVDFDNVEYKKVTIPNDSPSSYTNLKRTVEKVTPSNTEDYGVNSTGLIFTEKDTEDAYTHQIFIPSSLRGAGILTRYASGETWSGWHSTPISPFVVHRTFTNVTIPAHSHVDRDTTINGANPNDFYVDNTRTNLPSGTLVRSYCYQDGIIRTRIINVTDNDVTIPTLEISVRRLVF